MAVIVLKLCTCWWFFLPQLCFWNIWCNLSFCGVGTEWEAYKKGFLRNCAAVYATACKCPIQIIEINRALREGKEKCCREMKATQCNPRYLTKYGKESKYKRERNTMWLCLWTPDRVEEREQYINHDRHTLLETFSFWLRGGKPKCSVIV